MGYLPYSPAILARFCHWTFKLLDFNHEANIAQALF
jgi:hypothetical protein